ncbi:VanW family protein [Sporosarcina sp. JAI121]|uniref:VanW family protein n=1 Tax=Sporosarcina sp. JAI121 TaxID=2723064 RepID=UPI0015CE158C|nr:hypothetical protein [Sporosarcina sp. JAI121]
MGNKGFLNTFITVLAATLVFYGFSSVGALAISSVTSKNFEDQTYIGPFDVSRQKEQAVKEKLASDFTSLQEDVAVDLTYQDVTVELPAETVTYDVDKTVQQANSGKENLIVATVSIDGLRTVLTQQFPTIDFSEESIQSIASGVEMELGTGIMPLSVHITDYSDFTEAEIASSAIDAEGLSVSAKDLITSLNGMEIEPFATFSLFDFIRNNEIGHVSDEQLTVLATVLYTTILQTNFVVDERNIGNILVPSAKPGFEAAINEEIGLNFIFTNPNKSTFTLHTAYTDGTIHSSITGMPLLYSYEPYIGQIETFEPKTVQQFSAFVPYGQVQVADEGRKGMEVDVHRTVSYEGAVVLDELISSDFYAPSPKTEILPLKKDTTETTNDVNEETTDGKTDGETVDSQGNPIPSSSSGSNNGSSTSSGKNPSNVQGGGNTEEDEEPVQYDKGGNVIE